MSGVILFVVEVSACQLEEALNWPATSERERSDENGPLKRSCPHLKEFTPLERTGALAGGETSETTCKGKDYAPAPWDEGSRSRDNYLEIEYLC